MDLIYSAAKELLLENVSYRRTINAKDREIGDRLKEIRELKTVIQDYQSLVERLQTPQPEPAALSVSHMVLEKTEETGAPLPDGVEGEGFGFPPLLTLEDDLHSIPKQRQEL